MVYKARGNSVFVFLLDLSELNDNLGYHFGGMEDVSPILDFRRLLSRDIINSPYLRQYDITPKEIKRNSKRKNDGNILI